MRRSVIGSLTAVALLVQSSVAGAASPEKTKETYRQLNLFGDVFERVRSDYVEEISDKELIENAINGMLTALDPHSSYLNRESFEEMQVQAQGEVGSLGIEATMEYGFVKIISPIDDTPAAAAGLQVGDLITHLDGEPVRGLALSEAINSMRGPVGTDIVLTIRREGVEQPIETRITRAIVEIRSVRSRIEGDIAYIRIRRFDEQTESELKRALNEIKSELGDRMAGVILDLRNNPGGLLDQAVKVSDLFLDEGEIVSTRSRRPEDSQRFNAKPEDLVEGMPLVVLSNSGSAAASEIVAGALQYHRRAIILGTKSFGHGLVQTIIPLPGHGAIRLTTHRFYTPSGQLIHGNGITPDIVVAPANQLAEAIKFLHK